MVGPRHRTLVVCRGLPHDTAAQAHTATAHLEDTLWVGAPDGVAVDATPAAEVARQLGSTRAAVVLDLHTGFDGDTLGRVHGLVQGGGVLVLRLPDHPLPGRSGRLLERHLDRPPPAPTSRSHPPHTPPGSAHQDLLVTNILEETAAPSPQVHVIQADRGRGKSAGVGRALGALPRTTTIAVTGPHKTAVAEVLRFARRPDLRHVDPLDLLAALETGPAPHIIVVDEAARVPVPLLRALCRAAPSSHFVFATTTHGYEGTGRGFQHRFVPWLSNEPRPVHRHTPTQPIRWADGDPLERWVFDVLALDAAPTARLADEPLRTERLDRDRLVDEPGLLHDVFGLLVAAHYRTSPADLHHLLDDPEVALHVVRSGHSVVGVGWLVADGGLDCTTIDAVSRGQRLRGHALAESFICHAGHPDAARLSMWRSVRTAVHPSRRRQGIARRLITHEHEHHGDSDLIGTLFGATPGLLSFRRSLGYRLVRVGVSRSARSGVPSVLMLRPRSPAAHRLVDHLRHDLARDLPAILGRLDGERGVPLDPALIHLLRADLPAPSKWTIASASSAMDRYLHGATPIDALAEAPAVWLSTRTDWTHGLSPLEALAIRLRVIENRPWHAIAAACGTRNVTVVHRAIRRGLRRVAAD